jgi:ketosteroid isomerase-like protein
MPHDPAQSTNPNSAVVRKVVAALTALDAGGVLACFHDDGILVLPYESTIPALDKSGLGSLLQRLFRLYRQFTIELTHIYDLKHPDTLIARYEGDCIGRVDDVRYANDYLAIFEFTDGLISNWREYDNPMITAASQKAHAAAAAAAAGDAG